MLSSIILKKMPQEFCLIVSYEAKKRRLPLDEMMRLIDTEIKEPLVFLLRTVAVFVLPRTLSAILLLQFYFCSMHYYQMMPPFLSALNAEKATHPTHVKLLRTLVNRTKSCEEREDALSVEEAAY